jgi:hypothetical protein
MLCFFTCDILDAAANRGGQGSAFKQVKTYNYLKPPLKIADANPKYRIARRAYSDSVYVNSWPNSRK